ncbi:hypothetical protein [Haematobacter sp. UBA3484]|uniref:hypothetical protein n=1 Tax=Haematobacter sp. UBA3484 TaxID=1946582 RepID=UPI0025C4E6D4|nr:hypothetical protein [Haematobacter sp. UBA3484]
MFGAILGGISAISGILGAKKAGDAQQSAARQQGALQREMWETTRKDLEPWRTRGNTAGSAVNYLLGLGAAPSGYSFEGSPGYQFQMGEGLGAIERSAAARGGLFSGRAMEALQERGMNIANQDWYNNLNALMGVSGSGLTAASATAGANQNMATGGANALANYGNAGAAKAAGVSNALTGGISDGLSVYRYLQ